MILNALESKPLPVYGDGGQINDWLYAGEHAAALYKVISKGKVDESYNIGGHNECKNIDVVKTIFSLLEVMAPNKPSNLNKYEDLITFVTDRTSNDVIYAIYASKIDREFDLQPKETFK